MKHLGTYFLSGALFLLPVALIGQFLLYISGLVDSVYAMPFVFSFPLSVAIIIITGYFIRKIFKKRIKYFIHKLSKKKSFGGFLARLIMGIDSLSDQINKAYRNPVLYKVDDGIYKVGFITDDNVDVLESEPDETHAATEALPNSGALWVYAPYPLSFSGELVLVDIRKIKKLKKQESESLPLFVLSAGVIKPQK